MRRLPLFSLRIRQIRRILLSSVLSESSVFMLSLPLTDYTDSTDVFRVSTIILHLFRCGLLFYGLLATIYEQYLLSRLDKGKSPFWYRSASSFRILSHIGFFPLYNAWRYGMPSSSVMLTSVKNCVKSSASHTME